MIYGLDLFSGIGGITLALSEWVQPIAYCEADRYCQAVLLSRMSDGRLPVAPIWDDVKTLRGDMLPTVDIVYGGFPCQDVSVAGARKGLDGERTGLFREAVRLVSECRPKFVFLENVPGIRKHVSTVRQELEALGYDCRDGFLSAAEVGANHIRNRWWLLAYASCERRQQKPNSTFSNEGTNEGWATKKDYKLKCSGKDVAYSQSYGLQGGASPRGKGQQRAIPMWGNRNESWWSTEPDVGRVVNGLPFRVDRIKGLGNSVVPAQAKEAFKRLIGLKGE